MKTVIFILLGLFSIVGFGQSDLEISPIYVTTYTSEENNRYENIIWEFQASNIGQTEAGVTPYTIYLSRDDELDQDDLIVHNGFLGDDNIINPSSGINNNSNILIPSHRVTNKDFYIPWDFEANEEYFFIFKIDQDIIGGETNTENNTSVIPFYLSLQNELEIFEVDTSIDLDDKTPLLLIHGWQPIGFDAEGNISIWNNFLNYFNDNIDLFTQFKLYYVKYSSNIVPVNDLAKELSHEIDSFFGSNYSGDFSILSHSMGGLLSRALSKRNIGVGQNNGNPYGTRINKIITLGTPHHGSPMANGEIRVKPSALLFPQAFLYANTPGTIDISNNLDYILHGVFSNTGLFLPDSQSYNRWDLRWDNFDNFYDYSDDQNEINEWLSGELMNDISFDNKIIAYVGEIYDRRNIPLLDISPKTFIFYSKNEQFLNRLYYINDGIVPKESAEFAGHEIAKKRVMYNYYHDEMAKGRFDYINQDGTDNNLFGLIKADLLGNISDSFISSSISNLYDFPNTALGTNSTKDITVQNSGDLPLTISSIQLVGSDNAQFNFIFPTVPFDIQPNQTETFVVDFAPTSIGEKEVVFRINNSSANNPQLDIQLSGVAVETAETDYNTNTDPEYNFGDVYIYGGANLVTLNVSNSSSAPYTVADLNITGLNAGLFSVVQQPELPKLFNPGDSDTIILSFDPDTVGEKTAMIEASFEDSSIIDTANLIGNGVTTQDNPNASKLTQYQYWFNDDYAGRQETNLSTTNSIENLNFEIETTGINNGLHTLHFRIKDENNHWSSIISEFVYVQNPSNAVANQIVMYEYWYDDDYASRISGSGSDTNPWLLSINDNVGSLAKGLHQFHIRFKDSKGAWSSIVSEFMYNNKPIGLGANKIASYRFWFNDHFAGNTSGTFDPEETVVYDESIDISGLTANSNNFIHFQFKDIYGNWSSVLTEDFLFEALVLNSTVFLQGSSTNPFPGEENLMRDNLRVANLIPTTSPYSDALNCESTVFNISGEDAIVDWVWVELRDATDRTVVMKSKSALLQRDGDVVDIDGNSPVSFSLAEGDYFITINHRNHLGVMTASPITVTNEGVSVDFTVSESYSLGGPLSVTQLPNTSYAIFAGDIDANGQIQNNDILNMQPLIGTPGYLNQDIDLNGQVQNIDLFLIQPNVGRAQQYDD